MMKMIRQVRALAALLLILFATGCLLVPGKFTSTLDIRRDRSFTFTYVGEVIVPASDDKPTSGASLDIDTESPKAAAPADPEARRRKMEALAAALSKEYGYRTVRYLGDDRLMIDYRITGRLDHGFVFPFNPDAEALMPFVAIELRGADLVRVKAPGYAADAMPSVPGNPLDGASGSKSNTRLDGTFALVTDGAIVSQNQEDGPKPAPDGATRIEWRATPLTRDAPTAVLRLAALPRP